jgi:sporulation protein YlmC with PRC-barrel domain
MTSQLLSAGTLKGDNVINNQGEDLGHIEELMLNPQDGKIEYAVLSFGGFLGMGDKLFAVPFNQLGVDTDGHRMVLNVDKERLKDAPGFDKNNWPDFADTSFRSSVDSYYV